MPLMSKGWITSVSPLRLENRPRIFDHHGVDLLVRYTALLERRDDVVMDVQVMPVRQHRTHRLLGQPVHEAIGVMRQHHPFRMTALAHCRDRVYAVLECEDGINSKTVHPE